LTARRLIHAHGEGSFRTLFYGRGIEFATLREYVPGDDIRQIEWNTTARRGVPYVKTFVEERDLSILLVVDMSSSMEIKIQALLGITALLATLADVHEDRIGALGFTDRVEFFVPPRKSPAQPERILHLLLQQRAAGRKTSLTSALSFLHRVLKKKTILFVISDFLDREFEHRLLMLSQKHEIVGVYLYDPLERSLPDSVILQTRDPESGERRLVDAYDAEARRRHAFFFEQQKQVVQRAFARARADFCMLEATPKADMRMVEFLRRRQASSAPIHMLG
jgi:uncharacterized protein (DUF58 family)